MAGNGGKREGAGRPKGVPNKASKARQADVASTGATPLDVLIRGMRFHDDLGKRALEQDPPDKKAASSAFKEAREFARDAAPFVHPKLAAVEHKGEGGGPIKVTITGSDSGLL